MPASQPPAQPRPYPAAGVSMRDLLASCAAADAISRPPRDPDPMAPQPSAGREHEHPQAA
ncbi:hypothetical protein ABT124_23280 [Streptomyces sp. NPDC001982]|uniref:hypothetical protein n=1 Tax=unclassified Streptomyces TaxID=2593676 RepID=UPI00331F3E56